MQGSAMPSHEPQGAPRPLDAPGSDPASAHSLANRDTPAISGHSHALSRASGDDIELVDSEQVTEAFANPCEAEQREVGENVVDAKDGSRPDVAGGGRRSLSPSPAPRKARDDGPLSRGFARSPSDLEAGAPTLPERESFFKKAGNALKRHMAFVGPGVIASVAYLDPGNWSTDLAAGSQVRATASSRGLGKARR